MELSLYGCSIETVNPSPEGTTFPAMIFTDMEYSETRATVVYAHPNLNTPCRKDLHPSVDLAAGLLHCTQRIAEFQ